MDSEKASPPDFLSPDRAHDGDSSLEEERKKEDSQGELPGEQEEGKLSSDEVVSVFRTAFQLHSASLPQSPENSGPQTEDASERNLLEKLLSGCATCERLRRERDQLRSDNEALMQKVLAQQQALVKLQQHLDEARIPESPVTPQQQKQRQQQGSSSIGGALSFGSPSSWLRLVGVGGSHATTTNNNSAKSSSGGGGGDDDEQRNLSGGSVWERRVFGRTRAPSRKDVDTGLNPEDDPVSLPLSHFPFPSDALLLLLLTRCFS